MGTGQDEASTSEETKPEAVLDVDKSEPADDTKPLTESSDPPAAVATKTVQARVPPMEYMLGIADLTGELMRLAIQSVGGGNLDTPFQLCKFIRVIYDSFVSYGNIARELNRKVTVLRQSLRKVENACYTLHVRGSEIP